MAAVTSSCYSQKCPYALLLLKLGMTLYGMQLPEKVLQAATHEAAHPALQLRVLLLLSALCRLILLVATAAHLWS